jgi:hypothetical protein
MLSRRTLIALLSLTFSAPAVAHESPISGWKYDTECCGGNPTSEFIINDCAPVDENTITEVSGGFQLNLKPGDHPMVTKAPVSELIPYNDRRVRKSGDWRKHVCVSPMGHVYCVYLVPGGM